MIIQWSGLGEKRVSRTRRVVKSTTVERENQVERERDSIIIIIIII